MNIIILSGGSGKRLWPLSNGVRAKQFLRVLPGEEGAESMIERMVRRLRKTFPEAALTVAAPENQLPQLRRRLGDEIRICTEPQQRDTFSAAALACAFLRESGVSPEETVLICPVDPLVEESYYSCLERIYRRAADGETKLMLMGIRPDHPSDQYGYILLEEGKVTGFREKPDRDTAEEYIRSGALWNGGVFAFRLGYLLKIMERETGAKTYAELLSRYSALPSVSFDIAVTEKEKDLGVECYDGSWKDLGTWDALTGAMDRPLSGNAVLAESEDTHVINELKTPLIVLGISHAVVAATPDGILVADKKKSRVLKNYVVPQRPMTEKRIWGEYRVLDYSVQEDGSASLTKQLIIERGKHTSYQYHLYRAESWTVTAGEGTVILDGKKQKIKAGDVIRIRLGMKHLIRADTTLHIIEVQTGKLLSEEDIIRVNYSFESVDD